SPAHLLHVERAGGKIAIVHVGNLKLAAPRGLELGRVSNDVVVEEVQARDCPIRFGILRLLLYPYCISCVVEGHHAVALGIEPLIGEDRRSLLPVCCELEQLRQAMSEEYVVPQRQRDVVGINEIRPNRKYLADSLRFWLFGITQPNAPLAAI